MVDIYNSNQIIMSYMQYYSGLINKNYLNCRCSKIKRWKKNIQEENA